MSLPVQPGYRLAIKWAISEGSWSPEIEQRLDDLGLLLTSRVWPLPLYGVPSAALGRSDELALTAVAEALYKALATKDFARALVACADGNRRTPRRPGISSSRESEFESCPARHAFRGFPDKTSPPT